METVNSLTLNIRRVFFVSFCVSFFFLAQLINHFEIRLQLRALSFIGREKNNTLMTLIGKRFYN